uniref:Uncharacterized protein n=1 Tax=Arion vulgaris TaxID=1028688 RepID=A0A0B7BFD3_9EUPU
MNQQKKRMKCEFKLKASRETQFRHIRNQSAVGTISLQTFCHLLKESVHL